MDVVDLIEFIMLKIMDSIDVVPRDFYIWFVSLTKFLLYFGYINMFVVLNY